MSLRSVAMDGGAEDPLAKERSGGAPRWRASPFLAVLASVFGLAAGPAPAEESAGKVPRDWEARVAAALSARGGDENNYAVNGDVMVQRRWTRDTLTLRGLADYGKSGGELDAENYLGSLIWRRNLNHRLFWRTIGTAGSDQVQGRSLRLTAATGPGYRVWEDGDTEREFLDLWGSVGYRYERFRDTTDTPDNNLVDLGVGYDYQDVWNVVEFVHSTEFFVPLNDTEEWLAKSEATLSVPLIERLHFRTNARYEYVNEPATGSESSNWWLTIGLEYRL